MRTRTRSVWLLAVEMFDDLLFCLNLKSGSLKLVQHSVNPRQTDTRWTAPDTPSHLLGFVNAHGFQLVAIVPSIHSLCFDCDLNDVKV